MHKILNVEFSCCYIGLSTRCLATAGSWNDHFTNKKQVKLIHSYTLKTNKYQGAAGSKETTGNTREAEIWTCTGSTDSGIICTQSSQKHYNNKKTAASWPETSTVSHAPQILPDLLSSSSSLVFAIDYNICSLVTPKANKSTAIRGSRYISGHWTIATSYFSFASILYLTK